MKEPVDIMIGKSARIRQSIDHNAILLLFTLPTEYSPVNQIPAPPKIKKIGS